MPRASAFEHVRRRAEQICASSLDSRGLRLALLEAISQVVPFDAYAWLLTDPGTSVGTSPVADVPCLHELPRLVRLKYVSDVNHWTVLDTVGTAHLPAVRALAPGETWAGLLTRYGITDVASAVFRDRYGCWAWLDLWRSAGSGRFNDSEVRFLTSLVGEVTSAIRRCQAETFLVHPPGVPRPPGPAVLLLSPDLDVMRVTPESQHYLQILVPPPVGTSPIPANAYNVAAQLLAVEDGVNQHSASARVHLSQGHWLTLRAARLAASEPVPKQDIAVTIQESSPGDRLDMFSRSRHESAGDRTPRSPGHRSRHPRTRPTHVPLGAHRSGPPEEHLRQDLGAQPADGGSTRPGSVAPATQLTRPGPRLQNFHSSLAAREYGEGTWSTSRRPTRRHDGDGPRPLR